MKEGRREPPGSGGYTRKRGPAPGASLTWGLAAAAVYILAVAAVSARAGPRSALLFDGFAPPAPYNWVSPPPEFTGTNQPPQAGSDSVPLTATGSEGISVSTGDGQASAVAPVGAFPGREGERQLRIEITPRDPKDFGPAPEGMTFDGNAYTVQATYRPSGTEAAPAVEMSVLVRYPIHATTILRWTGTDWVPLPSNVIPASLQVFANVTQLGTFAAGAPSAAGSSQPWLLWLSIGGVGVAAIAGFVVRSRDRRKRRRRPRPRGDKGTEARSGRGARDRPQPKKRRG